MAPANPDALVLELMTMGLRSAAHLEDLLRAASPASPPQELAAEILRCCGRVIAALTANAASGGKKRKKAAEHEDTAAAAAACSPPVMPPRKRSRGAEALRVVRSGTTTVDDFIWRKYGQKEINGRSHPRLYYRCAYKNQGCAATRRVQRTQEAPAAYEIAYYGEHTCRGAASCHGGAAAPPPPGVVDFGSNARASAGGVWTAPAASAHQTWHWDGETMSSQGGWSSSSEAGFEAQTTHEWHDMAQAVEQPIAAPVHATDPVTEFLDGSFDWASVVNDRVHFRALLQ